MADVNTSMQQVLSGLKSMQQRGGFGRQGNREAADRLQRWAEIEDRAQAQVSDLLKKELQVKNDLRLTPQGQAEQLRNLGQTAPEEFQWVGREAGTTREAMDRLRALCLDYLTVPKDTDKQIQYWREMEIRQTLRTQPEPDQQAAFLAAAQRLDAETMRALQTGPGGAWFDGEFVERAESIYGQRRNSEAWKNLQSLQVYLDHVIALANLIARALLTWGAERAAIEKALGIALPSQEPAKAPAHG